jgi:hypothetical protein
MRTAARLEADLRNYLRSRLVYDADMTAEQRRRAAAGRRAWLRAAISQLRALRRQT